jgi:ABC-2 type transport system permease protein
MSAPVFSLAVRLRAVSAALAAVGMALVIVLVGALFPAVGDSIGKLDVPSSVATLLGGADYSTIAGWMRSEIGAIYGPLVVGATAITSAVAVTAGEEEDGILALTLAHPVARASVLLAKAAAVGVTVLIVVAGTFVGLVAGVAVAGGGLPVGHSAALCVHLAFFGWCVGALALALAGLTGRRPVAAAGAAAFAVLGFLINGFAPLVDGVDWLKYLSPFHYYAGHDPLGNGIHASDLIVLGLATLGFVAAGVTGFSRRDLRG